jgi:hypothetical protein
LQFHQAQLDTLNANEGDNEPFTEIPEGDELTLDQLDYYDLGPGFRSWTIPPYAFLGAGAYRVAIGLCDEHALKVNPAQINHNAFEAATWASLPDHLKHLFVPVLAVAPGPSPAWLIASRAVPLEPTRDNDYLAEQVYLHLDGLEDIGVHQLGHLGDRLVILDYGHNASDLSALLRQFADPEVPASLLD